MPKIGHQRGNLSPMEQRICYSTVGTVKRLKELEKENTRLKKLVAEQAVEHIQQVFEVGERRACRIMNQPRSTQRYKPQQPQLDKDLITEIHRLACAEPRACYRSITRLLRRDGWRVNQKRIHRLWKQEGLGSSSTSH